LVFAGEAVFGQKRTVTERRGHADGDRTVRPGRAIRELPGFLDLRVMVRHGKESDAEEVAILVRLESEEAWQNGEKSPAAQGVEPARRTSAARNRMEGL